MPIDLIVMSIVYFDKKRGIYGENPKHIDWVLNYAKPLFESWGYKVVLVSSDKDYLYWFNHIITKSKKPERNGKRSGWLLGGRCYMNREKVNPIKEYLDSLQQPYEMYEGIAFDEKERLERMHNNRGSISLLEKYEVVEEETYPICNKYGLLSPIYDGRRKRQGCWFCPNQGYEEMADTKQHYPHLWKELEKLNECKDLVSQGFKWGETFNDIQIRLDAIISNRELEAAQLSLFDIYDI